MSHSTCPRMEHWRTLLWFPSQACPQVWILASLSQLELESEKFLKSELVGDELRATKMWRRAQTRKPFALLSIRLHLREITSPLYSLFAKCPGRAAGNRGYGAVDYTCVRIAGSIWPDEPHGVMHSRHHFTDILLNVPAKHAAIRRKRALHRLLRGVINHPIFRNPDRNWQ